MDFPQKIPLFPSGFKDFSRISSLPNPWRITKSFKDWRILQGFSNPLSRTLVFPSEKKFSYIFPQKKSLLFFPQKKNPPTFSLRKNPCPSSLFFPQKKILLHFPSEKILASHPFFFPQKKKPPTFSLRKNPCPSSMCQLSSLRNYLVFPQNLHGFPSVKGSFLEPSSLRHPEKTSSIFTTSSVDTLSHILHPPLHILSSRSPRQRILKDPSPRMWKERGWKNCVDLTFNFTNSLRQTHTRVLRTAGRVLAPARSSLLPS